MPTDQRLIEDYIPIEAISAQARREKSIRKGHISTLHLWWARRPLVATRAALHGALVPAPEDKKARDAASAFELVLVLTLILLTLVFRYAGTRRVALAGQLGAPLGAVTSLRAFRRTSCESLAVCQ